MNTATLVGIYISDTAKTIPQSIASVEAVAEQGLVGDRYYKKCGTFTTNNPQDTGRALTLIESEAIERFKAQSGIELSAAEARRNLVTQGILLNELVGKVFYIGTVQMKGVRFCHPCTHLQQLTGKAVLAGLENCGGLRADILTSGVIQTGDLITVV